MTGCLVLPSGGHPKVQGFVVGVCAGVVLMLVIWMMLVIDGSLLRRIGLGVASDVGDEVRRVRGVHAVVSELLFDGYDVDHVIVAPTGVFAVEVKWSLSPTTDLDRVYGLAGHLHQARAGARSVIGLLRPVDPGVTVHAVLVLADPGAPRFPDPVHRDGVTVVNPMTTTDWTTFLGQVQPPVLTMTDARPPVDALVTHRDKRIAYELAHHQPAPTTRRRLLNGEPARGTAASTDHGALQRTAYRRRTPPAPLRARHSMRWSSLDRGADDPQPRSRSVPICASGFDGAGRS